MTDILLIVLSNVAVWLVSRHHYRDDHTCHEPDVFGTGSPIHDRLAEQRFRKQLDAPTPYVTEGPTWTLGDER